MNEETINPLDVLRTLASYWRTIATCVGAGFAAALAAALLSTPVYRSETLLSFNEDQFSESSLSGLASQLSGLTAIDLGLGGTTGQKYVALALLTSPGFLEDFVEEKALLPTLFSGQWNGEAGAWRESRWSKSPTRADGAALFRERILTVAEDRRTGLVRLAVEWSDAAGAAEWANELVRRANAVTRAWAIDEARESQQYLRAELEKTNVLELRGSINRLIEAELKKEMLASVRIQYSFRVIDEAKTSDPEDFVRPRRLVLVMFGLIAGLGVGIVLALVLHSMRRHPSAK